MVEGQEVDRDLFFVCYDFIEEGSSATDSLHGCNGCNGCEEVRQRILVGYLVRNSVFLKYAKRQKPGFLKNLGLVAKYIGRNRVSGNYAAHKETGFFNRD